MSYFISIAPLIIVTMLWILWRMYSSYHSLLCPAWLSWFVEVDNPFAANEIINFLPIINNVKILDIGGAPGRISLPLAKKVAHVNGHVTGLDLQSEMIKKTKLKAETQLIKHIDFISGSIE